MLFWLLVVAWLTPQPPAAFTPTDMSRPPKAGAAAGNWVALPAPAGLT